jgi:hypothetical protein
VSGRASGEPFSSGSRQGAHGYYSCLSPGVDYPRSRLPERRCPYAPFREVARSVRMVGHSEVKPKRPLGDHSRRGTFFLLRARLFLRQRGGCPLSQWSPESPTPRNSSSARRSRSVQRRQRLRKLDLPRAKNINFRSLPRVAPFSASASAYFSGGREGVLFPPLCLARAEPSWRTSRTFAARPQSPAGQSSPAFRPSTRRTWIQTCRYLPQVPRASSSASSARRSRGVQRRQRLRKLRPAGLPSRAKGSAGRCYLCPSVMRAPFTWAEYY